MATARRRELNPVAGLEALAGAGAMLVVVETQGALRTPRDGRNLEISGAVLPVVELVKLVGSPCRQTP